MSNEIEVYKRLISRWDVYAQQSTRPDNKGRYGYFTKKGALTQKDIEQSITSTTKTIGTYVVNPLNNTVVNPLIDLDNHDNTNLSITENTIKIYNELIKLGYFPYIEGSSGTIEFGVHIGLMCKPTSALICKTILDNVLNSLNLSGNEVFPKQTEVNDGNYGNLVKLPFQFNNRTQKWSEILNPMTLEPFSRDDGIKFMLELPDSVFMLKEGVEIPADIKKVAPDASSETIKTGLARFDDVFKLENIKPCIKACYDEKWILHGKGDSGHNFRIAIAGNMLYNGATERQVHEYFMVQQEDYSAKTTNKQIKSIQDYLVEGKKPRGCKKLMDSCGVLLKGMCETCKNKPKEKITQNAIKTNGAFDYIDRITEKNPIYFDTAGQFWLWCDEGYYKQVDQTEILLTLLRDIADPAIIQRTFKGELLEAARLRGRDTKVKPVPHNWIHIQNGVYDIRTGEISEPTPEYLFTDPVPHKLSGSEETPTIDKLFSEWVTPEKVPLLNEIAAYCLYNGYPIHRMFVLIGRGRNGKGQYRDFVVNLVGKQNRSASTLEQLINSRFETARLYNKKICTMGEINYTLLDRTAILKMLSGGDPIPGEMKNKTPFEFVNTAKLLINTNSLPQTSDRTDAFYSRCIRVEFGRQFQLGRDIIETIPQEEYDNFLTKSLRVLRELLDKGEFMNEGDIRTKEIEYERLSNPLTHFINIYYEKDENEKVAAWRLMDGYVAYCIEKGYRKPRSKNEFNDMLKINYDVRKDNLPDDLDKDKAYKNWVWVFGMKGKARGKERKKDEEKKDDVLPVLPVLPEFSLRASIEISYEILGKTGKTGKNDNRSIDENFPGTTILESSKTGKNPATELTKIIIDAGEQFTKNNGVINSTNIVKFSLWFCEIYKPKWAHNGETWDYQPSAIRGIATKLFKITPEPGVSA